LNRAVLRPVQRLADGFRRRTAPEQLL